MLVPVFFRQDPVGLRERYFHGHVTEREAHRSPVSVLEYPPHLWISTYRPWSSSDYDLIMCNERVFGQFWDFLGFGFWWKGSTSRAWNIHRFCEFRFMFLLEPGGPVARWKFSPYVCWDKNPWFQWPNMTNFQADQPSGLRNSIDGDSWYWEIPLISIFMILGNSIK